MNSVKKGIFFACDIGFDSSACSDFCGGGNARSTHKPGGGGFKGKDGTLLIDDLNDGKMTIPDFDIPTSSYDIDKFTEKDGIITYENGQSALGINVNQNRGDIDWVKVKESGVGLP